jgi:hypothetical protein
MSRQQTKFYLKTIIIIISLIILFGYGIFELWGYMNGPKLTIISPINGSAVSESLVSIAGKTKNAQKITLNRRDIDRNENGDFSEEILLSYGYNILELAVEDRFGKRDSEILQIVYK